MVRLGNIDYDSQEILNEAISKLEADEFNAEVRKLREILSEAGPVKRFIIKLLYRFNLYNIKKECDSDEEKIKR